jgi:ferredoxin
MARVEAIHTMCLGHGMCEEIAPEVFRVDKWGCVEVLDGDVPPELVARARDAVYRCPAKALLIDEG